MEKNKHEKLSYKHSQMLADFLRFSTNLPFLLQRKVEDRSMASFTLAYKSVAVFVC